MLGLTLLSRFAFWSLVSWIVLGWGSLPAGIRNGIPKILMIAGLASMGIAPFLEGSYSQEVTLFVGGPYPYHVETIQRSYTILAFGIGIVLLFLGILSFWGNRLPGKGPVGQVMKFTLALLILRVYFEKLGVPQSFALFVGIIWLIVPLAVYFGIEAAKTGSQGKFWGWLLQYTYGIRIFILVVMLLATHFHWGTHFDNSSVITYKILGKTFHVDSGSWEQSRNLIVLPQLILWPAVTLTAGLFFGLPAYFIRSRRRKPTN